MNLEKHLENLRTFQTAFKGHNNFTPTYLPFEERNLRKKLSDSEILEFLEADLTDDKVEMLDAIADVAFLAIGDYVTFGETIPITTSVVAIGDFTKFIEDTFSAVTPKTISLFELSTTNMLLDEDPTEAGNSALSRITTSILKAKTLYGDVGLEILDEALQVVFESNMSKLDDSGNPIINGENGVLDNSKPIGKILKSKNFFEPTDALIAILIKHGII